MTEAQQLDGLGWTPHRVFTEVFLNGKYRGSHELIESVKIQQQSKKNDARVDIDAEKGVIDPTPAHGPPGLFKGAHGMWYGFKDPDETKKDDDGSLDPEGVTPEKTKAIKAKITKYESVLYGKDYKDPVDGRRRYLDEDAAVDFYPANEFIKNWERDFFLSTYFSTADYSDPAAELGKNVAANDRSVWQSSQPLARYRPRAKAYVGEISYLKKWFQSGYRWMNGQLD